MFFIRLQYLNIVIFRKLLIIEDLLAIIMDVIAIIAFEKPAL